PASAAKPAARVDHGVAGVRTEHLVVTRAGGQVGRRRFVEEGTFHIVAEFECGRRVIDKLVEGRPVIAELDGGAILSELDGRRAILSELDGRRDVLSELDGRRDVLAEFDGWRDVLAELEGGDVDGRVGRGLRAEPG